MSRRRDLISLLDRNSPGTPPTQAPPLLSSWSPDVHDRKCRPPIHAGYHAIFERTAIFESCCSCDQREESEGSSGVQVGGDMSYKCTG